LIRVLPIPAYLLDAVGAHARTQHPREACGFLVGPTRGLPTRFVPIPNRHPHPERYFRMDDTSVITAFGVMDELGQDVLVVYHSHTRSGPELSTTDVLEAMDLDVVHLVCSTAKSVNQPTYQAWQIREPQPTHRHVEQVALDIIDDTHPDSPLSGLVEGNHIRLTWDGEGGRRVTVCTVGARVPGEASVTVHPIRPTGSVLRIALDRIRVVGILAEGGTAAHTRAAAASHLTQAALMLEAFDTNGARDAIGRAAALMPRIVPRPPPMPHAYRPRRRAEK
jgi:proteasome lid subunit RPN8/RPN11